MATFGAQCSSFGSSRAGVAGFPQGIKRKVVAALGSISISEREASRGLKVADARARFCLAVQLFKMARYPSGKGEVCKTFMRRFDSDPRLHLFQRFTPKKRPAKMVL
jgi:hypothetical protein